MRRKMDAALLNSEPDFDKNMLSILGLKPETVSYWTAKCGGLVLDSTNLCESSNGDFIVKFTYKLGKIQNQSVGKVRQNVNNNENTTKSQSVPPGKTTKVKRKFSSRRKRDRERFRRWLEKKKERKIREALNTAIVSTPPSSPKMSNPSPLENLGPPNAEPPEPPVASVSTVTEPVIPDQPAEPAVTPDPAKPHHCSDCERFKLDEEPYADMKYRCEFAICDKTASEVDLKTCTRCYRVAYCSKDHQREDWYLHKQVCSAEHGAEIRKTVEDWQRWKGEPHHHSQS